MKKIGDDEVKKAIQLIKNYAYRKNTPENIRELSLDYIDNLDQNLSTEAKETLIQLGEATEIMLELEQMSETYKKKASGKIGGSDVKKKVGGSDIKKKIG